jgi:type I restriction enzyme S subunit
VPLIYKSYKGEHGSETKKWSKIKRGYTHFTNRDIGIEKITPYLENCKADFLKT